MVKRASALVPRPAGSGVRRRTAARPASQPSPDDVALVPEFAPVPRRCARADGWTPERQRGFIEALADTGSVRAAAGRVGMAAEGAYQLRRAAGAAGFRAAWAAALDQGVRRLADIAIDRATEGVAVPVYDGNRKVGERQVYNDRLLMFCLRHHVGRAGGLEPGQGGAGGGLRPGTHAPRPAALPPATSQDPADQALRAALWEEMGPALCENIRIEAESLHYLAHMHMLLIERAHEANVAGDAKTAARMLKGAEGVRDQIDKGFGQWQAGMADGSCMARHEVWARDMQRRGLLLPDFG